MVIEILSGKAIRLTADSALERRKEWRPWKFKGYRIIDQDGVTVWHEREGLRRLVLEHLARFDMDVFLFGSQASGDFAEKSDYDIGYWSDTAIPAPIREDLKAAIEDLPVPFSVDLVNFSTLDATFKEMVLAGGNLEVWKKKSKNSLFT